MEPPARLNPTVRRLRRNNVDFFRYFKTMVKRHTVDGFKYRNQEKNQARSNTLVNIERKVLY